MRISATQASVLAAMRSGFVLRWSNGLDAYAWLNMPGWPHRTATALALESKGMIERHDETNTGCKFRLTDKARAYFEKEVK